MLGVSIQKVHSNVFAIQVGPVMVSRVKILTNAHITMTTTVRILVAATKVSMVMVLLE